jgi:hypothetical protein
MSEETEIQIGDLKMAASGNSFAASKLRDVLGELQGAKCLKVVNFYYQYLLHGVPAARTLDDEPAPCGHCIVCVSREAVKG